MLAQELTHYHHDVRNNHPWVLQQHPPANTKEHTGLSSSGLTSTRSPSGAIWQCERCETTGSKCHIPATHLGNVQALLLLGEHSVHPESVHPACP